MQHAAVNQCAVRQNLRVVKRLRAFTLVELLIVVVILGILATVVIPIFTEAAEGAKYSVMSSNLKEVRRALERYRFEHNNTYPPLACAADASDPKALTLSFLTDKTSASHDLQSGPFGPYLSAIPENPFTGNRLVYHELFLVEPDGNNASAWSYSIGDYPWEASFKANCCVEHMSE